MGCWGCGMFEGDSALDTLYNIEKIIGIHNLYSIIFSKDTEAIRVALNNNANEILNSNLFDSGDMMVVAAIIMMTGAELSDSIRELAMLGIGEEISTVDVVGWKDDGVGRKAVLIDLLEKLVVYDGEKIAISHTGLLETICGGSNGS